MAESLEKKNDTQLYELYDVYLSWAEYFIKINPRKAITFLNHCHGVNRFDSDILHMRSVCKRKLAQIGSALQDAMLAKEIQGDDPHISMEISDCLYELNQFEDCKMNLHENMGKYLSAVNNDFKNRLLVVDENFRDSMGVALDKFLFKNQNIFPELMESIKRKKYVQTRPLWKIRKEQGECDILSINEEQEILLSPIEQERRAHWYRIFTQIYFGKSWVDEAFLRKLVKDDKWLNPLFTESTSYLRWLLKSEYKVVKKFLRMLHARSPLYSEHLRKFGNEKFLNKAREEFLYQKQYQTRRRMCTVLKTIKQYRELNKIELMSKYVEEFMGDYVVLKSNRIMPWKFEFINEVYNTVGLAHADTYVVPKNFQYSPIALKPLLNIKSWKPPHTEFEFGNRSTYVPPDALDVGLEKYKKFISRLEKRLVFAKYSIEKCYLIHEMARAAFKQHRYDECNVHAKKAIEESKNCNSYLWSFLNLMLIAKSYAVIHKTEHCQNTLMDALTAATGLNNPRLVEFVQLAASINEDHLNYKRSRPSPSETFRKRSKHSLDSSNSNL